MIYDCFMFNREFHIFELRMRLLYDKVDQFVIVEGTRDHAGNEKETTNFALRYPQFSAKIKAFTVDLPKLEDVANRFELDRLQRNGISQGLVNVQPNDIVMISDLDEIPNPGSWNGLEGAFVQRHSYYYFDRVDPRPWKGTCLVAGWRFNNRYGNITPQDVRNFRDLLQPCGYGWHFSWIGSKEEAIQKMLTSPHTELNKETVARYYGERHPIDGTSLIHSDENLPKQCREFPQYFAGEDAKDA